MGTHSLAIDYKNEDDYDTTYQGLRSSKNSLLFPFPPIPHVPVVVSLKYKDYRNNCILKLYLQAVKHIKHTPHRHAEIFQHPSISSATF